MALVLLKLKLQYDCNVGVWYSGDQHYRIDVHENQLLHLKVGEGHIHKGILWHDTTCGIL
jgi:hypothetical protein